MKTATATATMTKTSKMIKTLAAILLISLSSLAAKAGDVNLAWDYTDQETASITGFSLWVKAPGQTVFTEVKSVVLGKNKEGTVVLDKGTYQVYVTAFVNDVEDGVPIHSAPSNIKTIVVSGPPVKVRLKK